MASNWVKTGKLSFSAYIALKAFKILHIFRLIEDIKLDMNYAFTFNFNRAKY